MEVKGITHCHSSYSYDAKLTLRELRQLFIEKGIQFACMTEHVDEMTKENAEAFVKECNELSDEKFIFIPGFEVPYKHAHVLMIGMREFFGNYAQDIEALSKWTQKASFVILAHPVRNQFSVDAGLLSNIHALEIWNQQYEGKRVPRTRSLALLAELQAKKPGLLATGGLDFHRKEHWGWPQVSMQVVKLNESSIIEKLKLGAYIVSSPQAHFYGNVPDIKELRKKYRFESMMAVCVITIGKFVNKVLAGVGISLPKSLKQLIRKKV